MKKKNLLALGMAGAVLTSAVLVPVMMHSSADEETPYVPTITTNISEGAQIDLLEGDILEFATNYVKKSSVNYIDKTDKFAPVDVTLDWEANEGVLYYTLSIATDKAFTNPIRFVTNESAITLDRLFANKHYYYQIDAKYEDQTIRSRIFDFYTTDAPRTIAIDGVSNTRDVGGMLTSDGKQIRQGMVYRTAYFDEITALGKTQAREKYHIKTDLDLRNSGEGATGTSKLGEDVLYYLRSFPYYLGDSGIDNANNWAKIAEAMRIFAEEDNYPIAFHCSLGRDRTGTMALLLQGLLGAEKKDILRDYETSAFSVRGTYDGGSYDYLVVQLEKTINYINSNGKSTFAENCAAFLIKTGMTQAEIDSIREIMLEEVSL